VADEALPAGQRPRAYLDIEAVMAAARQAGCDALHPGYGFLAENAALARRCDAEGLRFVGPAPTVLDLFGDKTRARDWRAGCGVPLVPAAPGAVTVAGPGLLRRAAAGVPR
jgi:acetyl/propionyl-CoA carboxylase alpha subunit